MTLTTDRRELYPAMTGEEIEAIDQAFQSAWDTLKDNGIRVIGDDRAENLVGAIARFVEDCRKDDTTDTNPRFHMRTGEGYREFEGTEGQDRESYSDDQDRESYHLEDSFTGG